VTERVSDTFVHFLQKRRHFASPETLLCFRVSAELEIDSVKVETNRYSIKEENNAIDFQLWVRVSGNTFSVKRTFGQV